MRPRGRNKKFSSLLRHAERQAYNEIRVSYTKKRREEVEVTQITSSPVLNIVEEPGIKRDSALNKEMLEVDNKG